MSETGKFLQHVWFIGAPKDADTTRERMVQAMRNQNVDSHARLDLWWEGRRIGGAVCFQSFSPLYTDPLSSLRHHVDCHQVWSLRYDPGSDHVLVNTLPFGVQDWKLQLPPGIAGEEAMAHATDHIAQMGLVQRELIQQTPSPEFVTAAMQGKQAHDQALAHTEWTSTNIALWWDVVEEWADQNAAVPSNKDSFGPPRSDPDDPRQAQILDSLGRGLPAEHHDHQRLNALLVKVLQKTTTNRPAPSSSLMAVLRAQTSAEQYWRLRQLKVSFVNDLDPLVPELFAKLPHPQRHAELLRAEEEIMAVMKHVAGSAQLGVSPQFLQMQAAAPEWLGWPKALERAANSNRAPTQVVEAWTQWQSEERARALSETWADGEAPRPKPRF